MESSEREGERKLPVRKFSVKTSLINFPKGISPSDEEGIKIAERTIRQLTGAEHVEVSFDHGPDGKPLLDQMRVYCEMPRKEGAYISVAELKPDLAKLLGEIVEAIASGSDAVSKVRDLLEKLDEKDTPTDERKRKQEKEEEEKPEGLPKPEDALPSPEGLPKKTEEPQAKSPGVDERGLPSSKEKPRLPFALSRKRASMLRAARARRLSEELEIPEKEARRIVATIEEAPSRGAATVRLSRLLSDEEGKPLPYSDCRRIVSLVFPERRGPLARR